MKVVSGAMVSLMLGLMLAACGSAPSGTGAAGATGGTTGGGASSVITGSVGDGPVTGATMTVSDSTGAPVSIGAVTSGVNAKYSVTIPAGASYPLIITAAGGADQTLAAAGAANTAPPVPLRSVILSANTAIANISPFTTLALATATQLVGGVTAVNMATAQNNVKAAVGMGLQDVSQDLLSTDPATFTTTELAIILKANEAIGELIHRTSKVNAASLPADSVITAMGKDLTDGAINGKDAAGTATDAGVFTDTLAVRAAMLTDMKNAAPTIKVGATKIDGTGGVSVTTAHLSTAAAAIGSTIAAASFDTAAAATIASQSADADAATVASVGLAAVITSGVIADGTAQYTVTAQLKDGAGNGLSGVQIAFIATGNGQGQVVLSNSTAITGKDGTVAVTVTDISSADETVTLSANAGGISSTSSVLLSFTGNGGGGATGANSITMDAITAVPADGSTPATVTVTLKDANGAVIAGSPVTLTTNGAATINSTHPINTNPSGQATFTLVDSISETVVLTATGGGVTTTAAATFSPVTITIGAVAAVPADGSTPATVTVTLTDTNGAVIAGSPVTLASNGSASLTSPANPINTNTSGQATFTLIDSTPETVILTATIGGATATGSATFNPVAITVGAVAAVPADGSTPATVTVTLTDSSGPIVGSPITLATNGSATITSATSINTNTSGQATFTLIDSTPETVSLTATGGGATATGSATFNTVVIALGAVTETPADGSTPATATVTLTDANGAAIAGRAVTLAATGAATITSVNPASTDASGQVTFTLIDSTPETVNLTATGGNATTTGSATFTSVVDSVTVNSTTPAPPSAPASGLDTIQATFLVTKLGVAVPSQAITFSGVGSLGGTPVISPASTTTDASGLATVTVSDTTAETVTVSATAAGVSGNTSLTFNALPPASIILNTTNPSPATIGITGAGIQASATLTFKVVDTNNNPVQGSHLIDFSILAGGLNGGEALTTTQASTISALASTVINSGTKAGAVQVRASLNSDSTIFADVSVTITGGLPSGESFQLSSAPLNIAGRKTLGLTQSITAFVSDFFSNPVAPTTQAQFQTDFANIGGTATFAAGTGSSSATTTLTSAAPQPVDGLVTVAAQSIGGIHAKVLSLAIDPADANIIYAGADGGGVFKTIDGGASWSQVGVPLQDLGAGKFANLTGGIVRDLVLDPNNSSIIYAATDKGLFVSVNAGVNWRSLTGIRRVLADNLGTVIAATGVFLSNGLWSNDGVAAATFAFNFQNAGTRARTTVRVGGTPTTAYRPTTGGIQLIGAPGATTPQDLAVEADYDTASSIPDVPFYAVAVDANTFNAATGYADTLYVGTFGDGVWKTTDGGKNWFRASAMAAGAGVSFGAQVLSLAIDTTAAPNTVLYAGTNGNGLFKSIDAAGTWTQLNGTQAGPLNESVVQDVIFNGANVWVAGKNAIHYSTDSGVNWLTPTTNVNAADVSNTDVRGLARDAVDGTLYAITFGDVLDKAAPHGGVYTSINGGVDWTKLADVGTAVGVHNLDALAVFGQAGNDILVAGSQGRSISRSADSGGAWTSIVGAPPANLTNAIFTTMHVMHSGSTQIVIIPQASAFQPINFPIGGGVSLGGFGSFGSIFNGGSQSFYIRVSDDLGNPLTAGSTIAVTASAGTLTGDTAVTLGDAVFGATDYHVTWTNDITSTTQDAAASLTVSVTSTNNKVSASVGRTLIKQVAGPALSVSGSGGTCASGIVTGTGGSAPGLYTFSAGSGNVGGCPLSGTFATTTGSASQQFSWILPAATPGTGGGASTPGTATDTITVTNTVTGATGTVTVTLTGN